MGLKSVKVLFFSLLVLFSLTFCSKSEKDNIQAKGSEKKEVKYEWKQVERDLEYFLKNQKYKDIKSGLAKVDEYFKDKEHELAFYYGVVYFHDGKIEEAKTNFQKAQAAYPGRAIFYLGHIARKERDFNKAVKYYKKAYEILKNSEILSSLGDIYYENKKVDTAIRYYKQAAKLNPFGYLDRYFLANAYFAKKQYRKSEKLLKEVLKLNPRFKKAYLGLSAIASQKKDKLSQLYFYCRYLLLGQAYSKVVTVLEKPKETFKDKRLLKIYIVSLIREGLNAKVKQVVQKGLSLYKNDEDLLMYKGMLLESDGKDDKALAYFGKLLKRFPKNFNIIVAYADLLEKKDRILEAISNYEDALKIDASNKSYRYKLAELYRKRGDFQKELLHRGILYLYQGQLDQAFEALSRVKKENASYSLYFYLGKLYSRKQKYEVAVKEFDKAILKDPKIVSAYLEKAYVLVKLKKKKEALKILNQYPKKNKEIETLKKFISKM